MVIVPLGRFSFCILWKKCEILKEERGNKHRGRKSRGTQKDKMSPRRTEWTIWIRLCLAEVLYDWQAYPDQTKAVKGQNSKTLVTASTIKRPLPCPV